MPKFNPHTQAEQQLLQWVQNLAPWEILAHFTYRWEASLPSAQRAVERFFRRHYRSMSYFYALEQNPSRDGYHVHALLANTQAIRRDEMWHQWFETYGRARIEPIKDTNDVTSYCAKYVLKERAWWDVKIATNDLWHGYFERVRKLAVERASPLLPTEVCAAPVAG